MFIDPRCLTHGYSKPGLGMTDDFMTKRVPWGNVDVENQPFACIVIKCCLKLQGNIRKPYRFSAQSTLVYICLPSESKWKPAQTSWLLFSPVILRFLSAVLRFDFAQEMPGIFLAPPRRSKTHAGSPVAPLGRRASRSGTPSDREEGNPSTRRAMSAMSLSENSTPGFCMFFCEVSTYF